ncbi:MAG TPA: PepSY domain-containing protein, partial [Verrucomicrobiales bacterium]|nr:PepSY domain-containing protein [Verrucomicrobiales bacterium]
LHSWADLSSGTRLLAWSRWMHKGEAFGRPGQIVGGFACLMMLVLIYTGWALAIRRILRRRQEVKNIP